MASRPLTVADRAPQVGDVLALGPAGFHKTVLRVGQSTVRLQVGQSEVAVPADDLKSFVYISRADGGTLIAPAKCPDCEGYGRRGYSNCDTCNGKGHVTGDYLAKAAEGERLRADRRSRGLTLKQEADRLGLSVVELSHVEQGRLTMDEARERARAKEEAQR